MSDQEGVPGRKFSQHQVERGRKREGGRCQGCGQAFPANRKKNPREQMTEGHHVKPRSLGGTNSDDNLELLCGPNSCHRVADELALRYHTSMREVHEKLGPQPFLSVVGAYERANHRRPKRNPARRILKRMYAA